MVIVNGCPIAGGLAGYFTNGNKYTPKNPNAAMPHTRYIGRMWKRPCMST